ncbi:MAG: gamma-glutamylcyclotransferase [Pseudomonadota bacterium]
MAADVWVFAYGSLMWRPDFAHEEALSARLYGYHRDFCILSVVHRGSHARPGLVLGLAPGGSCRGLAFRIASKEAQAAIAALDAREQVTGVYIPKTLRVHTGHGVKLARCYVSDTGHAQFAGRQDIAAQAARIIGARGQSGCNVEYLQRTLAALHALGIDDKRLTALGRLCGAISAP